ncbi:MAG TPA: hypothetical protein VEQ60_19630 [Longimicrobium sp.]|nr:hypothetical protein [Longimicrobium sp.]
MSFKTLALFAAAAFAAAPLAAQTPIRAGETVTGTLQEGDRQMEDGALYDAYVIRGRPGETLLVRMTSEDFDTYLHWGSDDGGDWTEEDGNDDFGDGTDSRLVVTLTDEGEYELRAAGFDEDEEGAYELRVTAMGQPSPGRITVGQTIQGELDESDYEGADGLADHYVIRGAPGTQVTVFARSDDFDTYLEFGPWRDGALDAIAEDDDGGQGTNSEMLAEFGDEGVYHVVVRAFDGEETGAYTLRVAEGAVSENWNDDGEGDEDFDEDDEEGFVVDTVDVATPWTEDAEMDSVADFSGVGYTIVPVRAGESVEDDLDEDDPQDEDGAYYQQFTYRARAGDRLTIAVTSDEMDAFVAIGRGTYDEFEAMDEDDDSGGELNAELTWTVPADGEYTVHVSTAAPGQTGAFVLRVRSTR